MRTAFTCFFPFSGLGAGARGFLDGAVELRGERLTFRSLGGIDFDQASCDDFEYLTESPALCADISKLTPAELRAFCPQAPDVVFMSPPCKSFSALLNAQSAKHARYVGMNRLVLDWVELMLSAWDVGPSLLLLENVPRIASLGAAFLNQVRRALKKAGYVFSSQTHDCGELGGLAQHRQRFLLVARHPDRCAPLLYQAPPKRVRACGEVLEKLPLPSDPAGGRMHTLSKLSWLNWVRLALIPAGGDWRDLENVLKTGQARREVYRRLHVAKWEEPSVTVAGPGGNGPSAVADPRLFVKHAYDHGYGVLRWNEAASTIAGGSNVGQGAYSVADIRFRGQYFGGTYGVMSWEQAAGTITGNARLDTGRFSVADPRQPPAELQMIIAADGTWHRPFTTLELAALQGFPTTWKGRPLELGGKSTSGWRERIGNAVPPPAAQAMAEQMLVCLGQASAGAWSMQGSGSVWVDRPTESAGCGLH